MFQEIIGTLPPTIGTLPPTQLARHHQDDMNHFFVGIPNKQSFMDVTGIPGKGAVEPCVWWKNNTWVHMMHLGGKFMPAIIEHKTYDSWKFNIASEEGWKTTFLLGPGHFSGANC